MIFFSPLVYILFHFYYFLLWVIVVRMSSGPILLFIDFNKNVDQKYIHEVVISIESDELKYSN